MFKDYYAARTLGTNQNSLDLEFADRVSNVQLNAIKTGTFKPFVPSENIIKAFEENARAIGAPNPYLTARFQIEKMIRKYENMPLWGGFQFPRFENPFSVKLPQATVPPVASIAQATGVTAPNVNPAVGTNQQAMIKRGQQVFGATDPIFGVG